MGDQFQPLDLNSTGFASANFQDAEDTRPSSAYLEAFGGPDSINSIVSQSLSRHISEVTPNTTSPQLGSYTTNINNWRKKLKEMMIHQNESILDFLFKPVTEHPTLGPVEMALRRFSVRHDIDVNNIKTVSELCSDISGADIIQKEIHDRVLQKGKSSISELRGQVSSLIDFYKETGEKVLECENQLRMRLDKMDKLHKKVSVVIELQKNDSTEGLIRAMDEYIKTSFNDMGIDTYYKQLIYLYQKHLALREAIQLFKTGSSLPTEPTCPICLADSISYACVPCGHTFCGGCMRRMSSECGICRSKIRDRLKIFMT
jgi:hypothetical protein